MITRSINGIEFDIEETAANELYFEENLLSEIGDGGLESILNMFWNQKKEYLPLSVTWEMTSNCNFKCPFCYIHTQNNPLKNEGFSFSAIRKDLEELISRGLLICYLTGGECLSHPDFLKVYEFLKRRGVLVAVLTNASLLTGEHFDIFKKYKPYKIEISIYGTQSTFSNDPENDCKKVMENILRLKQLDINVICKTPLNKCTEHQFPKIKKWCSENNIDFYYSNELFDAYNGSSLQKYKIELSQDNHLTELSPPKKRQRKKLFSCKASKYSFVIAPDLSLRPCLAFHNVKEAAFPAKERSMIQSLDLMISYIKSYNDKYLLYCDGCEFSDLCQECIVTQYARSDLREYMNRKCAEIQRYAGRQK